MKDETVLMSTILVTGSGLIKNIVTKKGSELKTILGGFVFGTFLFLINAASPDIARAMAIMVIVAAVLFNGPTIATVVTRVVK